MRKIMAKPPKVAIEWDALGVIKSAKVSRERFSDEDTSSRRVFIGRHYVLKAECASIKHDYERPRSVCPVMQNKLEAKIWNLVKDSGDARFFAPVVAHAKDYSWLVMKRIIQNATPIQASRSLVYDLEEKYGFDSENQYYYVDGYPVIYDYGFKG